MSSKYQIRSFLTAEEVMAALGIFTEKDLEDLRQTRLYKHWEKTGRIEYCEDDCEACRFRLSLHSSLAD